MSWPTNINVKDEGRRLEVVYDDGVTAENSAERLRVESPSAEVQGHSPEQHRTVPGCRNVGITAVEPVGQYAVRLIFDDGHDTGLYSWDYLYQLGQDQQRRWADYLAALAAQGLSRDR